ncbi:MAG: TraG family conjugative transposon ATPase [Dysgonomonas sp.]
MSVYVKDISLILSTEENKIICANGDFALGYKIEYPEKYSLGERDFDSAFHDWMKAMRLLPVNSIVLKSDIYLKDNYSMEDLPGNTFLQKATQKHFKGREYLNHIPYIFFIWTKKNTLKNENIKNPFKFPVVKNFKKEDQELKTFIESVKSVQSLLGQGQIKLIPLDANEINHYEIFYFNGFQNAYTSELEAKSDRFIFENKNIGIISIIDEKKFPDSVHTSIEDKEFSSKDGDFKFHQGFMDSLGLNLKYNHIYNQIIFIDEHSSHMNRIHKNFLELDGARRFSPVNEAGAKRLQASIDEINDDSNAHQLRGHTNIIYWGDNEAEFEYIGQQITTILNRLSFVPNKPKRERLKNIFYNSFFTNVSFLDNSSLYQIDLANAVALFINNGNYKNDEEGIILCDRIHNIPRIYDFWDAKKKHITSRNFAIIAPTGRGKSFTANYIFRQFLEQDIILVIIDLGDSYLKFSKLLPPEQVEIFKYRQGEPLGLNPFILDSETPSAMKIEELCEFVWTLIKKEQEPTELEQTSMRKIISHYYDLEDDHSWESFYKFIENNQDTLYEQLSIDNQEFFKIDEFLHAGSDFIGNGTYADLLKKTDKSENFVGKKLIIFELDEIKDNKLLLTIMLQVISEAIQKTIWRDRKNKGIVFFEEFAKQLEFPDVTRRVKYYTQAIRKYNGGVGLVLQTINQFPETPEGKSIIDNTETFIFLETKNYKDTISRLDLGSHDATLLRSVRNKHTGDGYKYGEVLIRRTGRTNVYRIEASKEEFIAYQTEGELHTAVMERYEQTHDMEIAINEYIHNN